MNLKNVAVSKVPSMISQWRTPCSRDSAGRTEYLEGAYMSICIPWMMQ